MLGKQISVTPLSFLEVEKLGFWMQQQIRSIVRRGRKTWEIPTVYVCSTDKARRDGERESEGRLE
jgi:hypothetical protein